MAATTPAAESAVVLARLRKEFPGTPPEAGLTGERQHAVPHIVVPAQGAVAQRRVAPTFGQCRPIQVQHAGRSGVLGGDGQVFPVRRLRQPRRMLDRSESKRRLRP